ncbi:MAG: response regulator, partial [Treponema sp.]|nr:response regulator [Treponema sp.]
MSDEKIKIVIADDSAIIRGILEKALDASGDFEILASVSNGRKAVDAVKYNPVDLVISDIDMPELNGIEAAKIITQEHKVPVVIFSEDRGLKNKALDAGAVLFEEKPPLSAFKIENLAGFIERVHSYVKNIKPCKESHAHSHHPYKFKVVVLGASTGGPTAVQEVLSGLGPNFPLPIVYVQHIDVG